MLPIGQLLERFKNVKNSEKFKKELVVEIFTKNMIPVDIKQISFSKNALILKTNPIIKTETLLKKEELLKQIQNIPGLSIIKNIQ